MRVCGLKYYVFSSNLFTTRSAPAGALWIEMFTYSAGTVRLKRVSARRGTVSWNYISDGVKVIIV